MKIILLYLSSWQLSSGQLFLALLSTVGVVYLGIILLRKQQSAKIEQLSLKENIKDFQIGNALRTRSMLRILGSTVVAVVGIAFCSFWVYVDNNNRDKCGEAGGYTNDSEEQSIELIGAVEFVNNPKGNLGTFHAKTSASAGDAGYEDDENFAKIRSYARTLQLPKPPPPPVPIELIVCQLPLDPEEPMNCYDGRYDSVHIEKPIEEDVLEGEDVEPEIFSIVEQMPRFPGCEDMEGDNASKKQCADQKMLQFIYKNLKYPELAKDTEIEGMVVVSFVVAKDGSIQDAKVRRDIGGGCGEEGLRIVELMNQLPQKWTPGFQNGQAVNVKYNLPIRIKLR